MSTNSQLKADHELDVFTKFVRISGLPIDLASIRQCGPPAPDILCDHAIEGQVGFELTEFINHETSARKSRQIDSQNALHSGIEALPATIRAQFEQEFSNALCHFDFVSDTTTNRVRAAAAEIAGELLGLPSGFVGELTKFKSKSVARITKSVSISRGEFTGPLFSVLNIGGAGDSVAGPIQKKLMKNYEVSCPIELVGYLDTAAIDPRQLWEGPAFALFKERKNLAPFRRIWIVNLRNGVVEYVHPSV